MLGDLTNVCFWGKRISVAPSPMSVLTHADIGSPPCRDAHAQCAVAPEAIAEYAGLAVLRYGGLDGSKSLRLPSSGDFLGCPALPGSDGAASGQRTTGGRCSTGGTATNY